MTHSTHTQKPFASVIVCCYNSASCVGPCIESVLAQKGINYPYEVIVIDDGSTDDTITVAQSYEQVRITRHTHNKGIPAARNTGLTAAKGDVLVFIDSDCIADPDWLKIICEPFSNAHVGAVGGKVLALTRLTISQRYMEATGYGNPARLTRDGGIMVRLEGYFRSMTNPTVLDSKASEVATIYTANAAYRKTALLSIGTFDEKLKTSEDSDISTRLRSARWAIYYMPHAIVKHRHYETLTKVLREPFARAHQMFDLYIKNKSLPPIFPMPILYACICLIALILLPRHWALSLFAIAVSPFILYIWWPIRSIRERRAEYLIYGYIQCLSECLVIIGIIMHGFFLLRKNTI